MPDNIYKSIILKIKRNMNHLECVTPKRNKWWWYLLTVVGSFLASVIIGRILLSVYYLYAHIRTGCNWHAFVVGLKANNNLLLFIELFVFAILLVCMIVLIKVIHGRKWTEVINGTNHVRWSRFFHGFAFWSGLMLVGSLIDYFIDPNSFVWQFNLGKFILLFFISIILVPIQTSCEEFIFRGYLTQGFASWTKNRWCALIFPSLLFALGHLFNPECAGYGYGIMLASYILTALTFGLITILDDGAELAMGAHTANNLLTFLLIDYKNSVIPTNSLFYTTHFDPHENFISSLILTIILIITMSRVYKWKFNVLNKKVATKEMRSLF
jgi:membrane protease YdiL (CAAX protease family)